MIPLLRQIVFIIFCDFNINGPLDLPDKVNIGSYDNILREHNPKINLSTIAP